MTLTKEYFYEIFNTIILEIKESFPDFQISVQEYRTDYLDNGDVYWCDSRVKLIAEKMYINLWFQLSNTKNKPFNLIIAFGDETNKKKGFPLQDYLAARNVDFDKSLLFKWLGDFEESIELSRKIIVELKRLIMENEIQKLLYTDYDIDLPRDYSPYK